MELDFGMLPGSASCTGEGTAPTKELGNSARPAHALAVCHSHCLQVAGAKSSGQVAYTSEGYVQADLRRAKDEGSMKRPWAM